MSTLREAGHSPRGAETHAGPEVTAWRRGDDPEALVTREWLVTNGRGGYASGTLAGVATRRYHGPLVAALPVPLGRTVMLNHLEEQIVCGDRTLHLTGDEPASGGLRQPDLALFAGFTLELGLPVWRYDDGVVRMTRRLVMPHLQNTTVIVWELDRTSPAVRLILRPSVHFRPHEHDVSAELRHSYSQQWDGRTLAIREDGEVPPLRMAFAGGEARFDRDERQLPERLYRIERQRGYSHEGTLWTPGELSIAIEPGSRIALVCSTEEEDLLTVAPEETFEAERRRRLRLLSHVPERDATEEQLILAADQFVIVPAKRWSNAAPREASKEDARTVIAGYHWFTDWGRDTMISLEGLTIATGRDREAASILRTFAGYARDGLIPNMFPEGESEGVYHTADATLWFFHAVHRYVEATDDRETLSQLLPTLQSIVDHHLQGTRFGIGVDPSDGLLRQGEEGYQLTWMDAKCDGWVVTPRRGKAVEINALFYNALRLLENWSATAGEEDRAKELGRHAGRLFESFNERFWFAEGGYLYDVVDSDGGGNDSALRPNQIFAVSLEHPVLSRDRWAPVVERVRTELLTPVGLRSLARTHPDYEPVYEGDLRTRDAAYHQGTVWSWLIGPFIDAWLKVRPDDRSGAREMLSGLVAHLSEAGIGSISEIFDAEPPFVARGCIAQAWGVAELLRSVQKTRESAL